MKITAIRSGKLVSGPAKSRMATKPKHRPATRRQENRSIPNNKAIGKANIGTVEIKIDNIPAGK